VPDHPFPDQAALCEGCGYALRGLTPGGDCPECGRTIADSSPAHRTGPAWQQRMSGGAYFNTLVALIRSPNRFFRTMRVDGSNLPPRLFLLIHALLTGALWAAAEALVLHRPAVMGYLTGMIAAKAVIALAYIEAAGVAYVCRRRGWRVPLRQAERLVGYASPGLLLAALLLMKLRLSLHTGLLPLPTWLSEAPGGDLLLMAPPFALSILVFETLVWLGVRRTRYANHPHPPHQAEG